MHGKAGKSITRNDVTNFADRTNKDSAADAADDAKTVSSRKSRFRFGVSSISRTHGASSKSNCPPCCLSMLEISWVLCGGSNDERVTCFASATCARQSARHVRRSRSQESSAQVHQSHFVCHELSCFFD